MFSFNKQPPAYLVATDFIDNLNNGLAQQELFRKIEDVRNYNVHCFTKNGVSLLLKVAPPDENVEFTFLDKDGSIGIRTQDVRDVFKMIQQQCICWSELNEDDYFMIDKLRGEIRWHLTTNIY